MWLFFFLISKISAQVYSIDMGTGADGACAFNNQAVSGTYNCTTVVVTGVVTATGTSALIIKSLGSVLVSGTLRANGGNGSNGAVGAVTGGTAVALGGDGGACAVNTDLVGGSGVGTGAGAGGAQGFDIAGLALVGGGGGGAGSYGAIGGAGTKGVDGPPVGGAGGAAGAIYGSNSTLVTSPLAGSGGAAGGTGDNLGAFFCGAGGGAGGGYIRIAAGGDVLVDATGLVTAHGGDGGAGLTASGGGGGGSGGGIAMQSLGNISIAGSVTVTGGSGGLGAGGGAAEGLGGNGGLGRILFQDIDGTISVTGTVSPGATTELLPLDTSFTNEWKSDISCGQISNSEDKKSGALLSLAMGLILVALVLTAYKSTQLHFKKFHRRRREII